MTRIVALCGLIAVLGIVLFVELATPQDNLPAVAMAAPMGPSQAAKVRTGQSPPHELDADALADIAAAVTGRPLFSSTRRPSNGTGQSAGSMVTRAEVPRLTGVIVGPSGGWAIFAGADGKSHAAATGDIVGAFKVRAIGPGVVTLIGSEGERVLRPSYETPPAAASSDIPTPDAVSPFAARGNRNREGAR